MRSGSPASTARSTTPTGRARWRGRSATSTSSPTPTGRRCRGPCRAGRGGGSSTRRWGRPDDIVPAGVAVEAADLRRRAALGRRAGAAPEYLVIRVFVRPVLRAGATCTKHSDAGNTRVAQRRAMTSTLGTTNTASGSSIQARQPAARSSSSCCCRQPVGHGLLGEAGLPDPVRPQPTPPAPLLGRGERPGRAGDGEIGEAAGPHPRRQVSTGVGLGAVARRQLVVRARASGRGGGWPAPRRTRRSRCPARRARRPDAAPATPRRRRRPGSVRCCSTWWAWTTSNDPSAASSAYDRADGERRPLVAERLGLGDDIGGRVDPDDTPRRHPCRQVDGDRARPAPDVEQVEPRPQVGEQVAGRVLGRPPPMAPQHALVVAVRVDVAHARQRGRHHPSISCYPEYGARAWPASGTRVLGVEPQPEPVERAQPEVAASRCGPPGRVTSGSPGCR